MLPSNGRASARVHYNYHITLKELSEILGYVKKHYDPKWHLFILWQFSFGQRCQETAATNIITDFNKNFTEYTYRQEKSNKIIQEKVSEPLRQELLKYIKLNAHRIKDGYLFACYSTGHKWHTTETIGAYWCKLRQGLYKETGNIKWLDKSPVGRHRVSSHSLRRLHRTVLGRELGKKGYTDFVIAKLCNYQDVNTFMIYRNEFELLEQKDELVSPIINPILYNLMNTSKEQNRLTLWT